MKSALIILLLGWVSTVWCREREHRVHNIVLYPDRHSWCQLTPIQQVVGSSGYKSVTINNNVCVGACFSYSIPTTQPAEPGEQLGPYCDSCQPQESKCYHVSLEAEPDNASGPQSLDKRVRIISSCSCRTCGKVPVDCDDTDHPGGQLPLDFYVTENKNAGTTLPPPKIGPNEDLPELFTVDLRKKHDHAKAYFDSTKNQKYEHKYELSAKLIELLRTIQDAGTGDFDKNEIQALLDMIEGTEKRLTDKNLLEFVNYVNVNNDDDLEVDLGKLKSILVDFENRERVDTPVVVERGRENNAAIESDIVKYDLAGDFGLEGSTFGMARHRKGSHIGMGIHHISSPIVHTVTRHLEKNRRQETSETTDINETPMKISLDTDPHVQFKPTERPQNPSMAHHPHHHFGEEQQLGPDQAGHLVKGPHGSLVFAPDYPKVEEKLNIDTAHLQPNHGGIVISYENHQKTNEVDDD